MTTVGGPSQEPSFVLASPNGNFSQLAVSEVAATQQKIDNGIEISDRELEELMRDLSKPEAFIEDVETAVPQSTASTLPSEITEKKEFSIKGGFRGFGRTLIRGLVALISPVIAIPVGMGWAIAAATHARKHGFDIKEEIGLLKYTMKEAVAETKRDLKATGLLFKTLGKVIVTPFISTKSVSMSDGIIDLSKISSPEELKSLKDFVKALDNKGAKQLWSQIKNQTGPLAPAIRLEKGPLTIEKARVLRDLVLKLSHFVPSFPRLISLEKCDFQLDDPQLKDTLKALFADENCPEQLIDEHGKVVTVDRVAVTKRLIGLILPQELTQKLEEDELQLATVDETQNKKRLQQANENSTMEKATLYSLRDKEPNTLKTVQFTQITKMNEVQTEKSKDTDKSTGTKNAYSMNSVPVSGAFDLSVNGITYRGAKDSSEDRMVLGQVDVKGTPVVIQAVIDGHNKDYCASIVQKELLAKIQDELAKLSNLDVAKPNVRQEVSIAIKKAFIELKKSWDEYVEAKIAEAPEEEKGAVAKKLNGGADVNCSIVIDNYVFCANVGDSKALFIDENKAQLLSPDTNLDTLDGAFEAGLRGHPFGIGSETDSVTNERSRDEEIRITAVNERFATGAGGALPTSRSIGDKDKNTIPIPVVTYYKIPAGGGYLYSLCDGVSDTMPLNDVTTLVRANGNKTTEEINQAVCTHSAQIGGGDDKTLMLMRFKPKKQ